ncbi:phycobilisome rod-core linker polypeptide [Geitlerinema sp. PCC 7407]|uniref:phycobilisome rod-core linker polypeptide n=1 Tax=Geitlerinema sp. PCC 7407 TaxID=1173025 RepID=UPI00029F8144|nr:phycobilisome rod-core linker polypeptide [Geitlerinema sp. PCC 7407]AFY67971.1 Phycobilisome linker polypeptide [Geitlerinema sp. PCC 7407]
MAIPLLKVTPKTQNQRVDGYEIRNEDAPVMYRLTSSASAADVDQVIWAAYRQIFGEHMILESYRQRALESQLRNRLISVQEFIRGLGKSDVYRSQVAELNSNYRLVDVTFKRFLGRATYGQDEQIAWSIVIATRGLHGFIDAVIESDEYQQNFGGTIVPYQRRRYDGRPFNLVTPRYNDYWRGRMIGIAVGGSAMATGRSYQKGDRDLKVVRQGIPATFFNMTRTIVVPERNYQRDADRASAIARSVEIPDMTRDIQTPQVAVGRTEVALPYRYIPAPAKTKA